MRIVLTLTLVAAIYGCARVPITGRRQLNLISSQELISMSFAQYEQVIQKSELSDNDEQTKIVKKVGLRIQKGVEQYMQENNYTNYLADFEWEFNLLKEETINAWCMPGGKVVFYTGIMEICQDEKGVAVVMGHEVAHAIAHHGRERMSSQLVANGLLGGVSVAMGQNPGMTNEILMQSIGAGTQIGMLSFSRKHESEADKMGLIFMAMAGYDPVAAPEFWERMANRGDSQPPEFISSHPSHETRISDLKEQIPEAMKYFNKQ